MAEKYTDSNKVVLLEALKTMVDIEQLQTKLRSALRLSGFNLRREYCTYLVEKFVEADVDLSSKNGFNEVVLNICQVLETHCQPGQSVEFKQVERALEVCLHSGYDQHETICSVINAFDFPKMYYNEDRKIYLPCTRKRVLLADATAKSRMFLERYSQVLQKTRRAFAQTQIKGPEHELTLQTVDYLLTLSEVTLERTLILGSLLQVTDGKYVLEDPTGTVQLDLSHAKYHPGFYTECCIVLVNGYYEDKVLHVSTMIMPTGEDYINSRPSFGNLNYFGGPSNQPLKDSKKLHKHLLDNSGTMFVFLSDVWLDHSQTFVKLDKLFEQMECFAPSVAFVFMGNFMSESHGIEALNDLRKHFKHLGELISKYDILLKQSRFIFVPGLADPCMPHVVPRLELPKFISDEMHRIVPNAIFATNPCRIQYCSKEIVVFRADLMAKFIQGTLHKPSKEETPKCIAKTIIGQGHLTPLSLNALNVHWDFDYCMSLYPLPDLVVIGDKAEAYAENYKGCIVMNPGPFCTGEYSFKMYNPSKTIDEAVVDCAVDVVEDVA